MSETDLSQFQEAMDRVNKAVESSQIRLSDAVLTVSSTVWGFSVIFLTGEATFEQTGLLRISWIFLGIAVVSSISTRWIAFSGAVQWASKWSSSVLKTLKPVPGTQKFSVTLSDPGPISSWQQIILITISAFALAAGLISLLAFGYVNVD